LSIKTITQHMNINLCKGGKVSSNLIRILAKKQWSQRRLARASGFDPVYINRIINERRDIRISTAQRLAKALECTIDELFTTPEETTTPELETTLAE